MCQLLNGTKRANQVSPSEVKNKLEITKIGLVNQVHTIISNMLQYSHTKLRQNLKNLSLHLIIKLNNNTNIKMGLLHQGRKIVQLISI